MLQNASIASAFYCIDCGYLLLQNSTMEKYHEILDVKYWTPEQKTGYRFSRPKLTKDDSQTFRVIGLMGLSFMFWGLSGRSSTEYGFFLNLVGWFFAFWSLYMVLKLNLLRRTRL